jgi:diguanylate cyclase (GGDEF)-like protein
LDRDASLKLILGDEGDLDPERRAAAKRRKRREVLFEALRARIFGDATKPRLAEDEAGGSFAEIARDLFWVLLVTGALGLTVTLPSYGGAPELSTAICFSALLALAVYVLWRWDRIWFRGDQILLFASTALISSAIFFDRGATPQLAIAYAGVTWVASFYLPRRRALLQLALAATSYAAALLSYEGVPQALRGCAVVVGVLALIALVAGRVGRRFRAERRRLARAAYVDGLTGLYNRDGFMRRLQEEIDDATERKQSFALVLIDLDRFKEVNDRFGHQAGDALLSRMTAIVRDTRRSIDVLGRVGGEEFAVLMTCATLDEAILLSEELRTLVQRAFAGGELDVTISVGIAAFPQHGWSLEHLMWAADCALYQAKEKGRNRVEVHDASGHLTVVGHYGMKTDSPSPDGERRQWRGVRKGPEHAIVHDVGGEGPDGKDMPAGTD